MKHCSNELLETHRPDVQRDYEFRYVRTNVYGVWSIVQILSLMTCQTTLLFVPFIVQVSHMN